MVSFSDAFSWVGNDDINGAPNGGIIGACSPEGRYVYVIPAYHDGYLITGNYEEEKDYVEFELWGNKSSMDWEYLVSSRDVAGMDINILCLYIYYTIIDCCQSLRSPGIQSQRCNFQVVYSNKMYMDAFVNFKVILMDPVICPLWIDFHLKCTTI